jgi:hypothetical protein
MTKTHVVSSVLAVAFAIGGFALAQAPKDNISKGLHPNLAAAQRLSTQAYEKITAAQEANEFDLAGHAAKAKTLLEQVNSELKLAAQTANKNKAK